MTLRSKISPRSVTAQNLSFLSYASFLGKGPGRLMNIIEAMADPNVFAPHFKGPSWEPWKAALAAIFALPMDG
jgi:hypothetical protein